LTEHLEHPRHERFEVARPQRPFRIPMDLHVGPQVVHVERDARGGERSFHTTSLSMDVRVVTELRSSSDHPSSSIWRVCSTFSVPTVIRALPRVNNPGTEVRTGGTRFG